MKQNEQIDENNTKRNESNDKTIDPGSVAEDMERCDRVAISPFSTSAMLVLLLTVNQAERALSGLSETPREPAKLLGALPSLDTVHLGHVHLRP